MSGSCEPRNCSSGLSTVVASSVLITTFQLSARRTSCTLCTIYSCDFPPASGRCLQLHLGRRGLSRTDLCFGNYGRPSYCPTAGTIPSPSIQGLELGNMVTYRGLYCFAGGSFLPSTGPEGRCAFLLCHVRYCWSWGVSVLILVLISHS